MVDKLRKYKAERMVGQIPTIPKTIDEFLLDRKIRFDSASGLPVCPKCYGYGKVNHPNAVSDIYEGYKFAEQITCTTCDGSKFVSKDTYRKAFESEKENIAKDIKEYKERLKVAKKLISKFSDEEIAKIYYLKGV